MVSGKRMWFLLFAAICVFKMGVNCEWYIQKYEKVGGFFLWCGFDRCGELNKEFDISGSITFRFIHKFLL